MKVSLAMLLKTNIEKMSDNRSLAMLMKPNELKSLSGDVDEKKQVNDKGDEVRSKRIKDLLARSLSEIEFV